MATSKEQWDRAFEVLERFERKILDPEEFGWAFLTEYTGVSKPTLWRNEKFRDEFNRIKKLVRQYKNREIDYDIERSKLSKKDAEIEKLKKQVDRLETELSRERERLAYAAHIARLHNIDPEQFNESSPLSRALKIKNDLKKNSIEDDPLIASLMDTLDGQK